MNEITFEIVKILVMAFFAILGVVIAKVMVPYVNSLTLNEEQAFILSVFETAVKAMEEQIKESGQGKLKKTQAIAFVRGELHKHGIEITDEQLDKLNEVFNSIGITLEPFSKTTCVIRDVPVWFEDINEQDFINDLVEEILNEKKMSARQIRKDKIASLACHSSIRFNRKLDVLESRQLLSRLSRCAQPFNCPHGRPTMMAISEAQLQKEFKRV